MKALDIIEAIRAQGITDTRAILDALEDGEALAAIGVTDGDQEAVEEAYDHLRNNAA